MGAQDESRGQVRPLTSGLSLALPSEDMNESCFQSSEGDLAGLRGPSYFLVSRPKHTRLLVIYITAALGVGVLVLKQLLHHPALSFGNTMESKLSILKNTFCEVISGEWN